MRNILVVDDDPVIRRELCGFLEEYSRETGEALVACEAENGQKAIEAVCARPIELIFSDIKMPLCTGTQMMEKLRELGYAGQVVIISGFEDYSLIRSSMKLGASDYLLKPIAQEEFRVVLRECLGRPQRPAEPLRGNLPRPARRRPADGWQPGRSVPPAERLGHRVHRRSLPRARAG